MSERSDRVGFSAADFRTLIDGSIPLAVAMAIEVVSIGPGTASLRLPQRDLITRPGATVSGPSLMALADIAMYAAILGQDSAALSAVTSNFNIAFLRATQGREVTAEATVVRMGRRLVFLQVYLYEEGSRDPVAHATGTYARPST
ncbi:MAG: PaaI family thioesterase [Alphaproteobacteria bacterium]|nr:PaaI family thioesterase [Alphaproteobacteria bacterium]